MLDFDTNMEELATIKVIELAAAVTMLLTV